MSEAVSHETDQQQAHVQGTLLRIFYLSKAADGVTKEDHEQILAVARERNQNANVTGLLVCKDGYFAQALEGDQKVVMELFEKIRKDPRHTGVIVLAKMLVEKRIFPSWEMGYRNLNGNDCSPRIAEIDLQDTRYVTSPHELSVIFKSFVED